MAENHRHNEGWTVCFLLVKLDTEWKEAQMNDQTQTEGPTESNRWFMNIIIGNFLFGRSQPNVTVGRFVRRNFKNICVSTSIKTVFFCFFLILQSNHQRSQLWLHWGKGCPNRKWTLFCPFTHIFSVQLLYYSISCWFRSIHMYLESFRNKNLDST